MDILKLMASNNFIIVNRDLIKEFGTNGAILLGELASEYNYYNDNNRLCDDGMFFSTVENVENNTGLSRYQQKKAIDELKKKGVIDVELRGMPAKRYIRINTNKLFSSSSLETSKQDSKKLTNKNVRNSLTSSQETNEQDSKKLTNNTLKTNEQDSEKLTTNNNKYKNNNINNNNIYIEDTSKNASKSTSKRFIKPTIEEIKEYCGQNDLRIDCERFYDYYESNDWHVGKNKMKDWKATARNWNRNNYSNKKNASNSSIYTDNNKVYEDDWFNDDLSDLC